MFPYAVPSIRSDLSLSGRSFYFTLSLKVLSPERTIANTLLYSLLFSHSVMLNSLRLHELQHTRLPYPSLSPGVCSDSCPLSRRMPSSQLILCHLLLILPSIFPASGSFPMCQLFTSSGQSIWVYSLIVPYISFVSFFVLTYLFVLCFRPSLACKHHHERSQPVMFPTVSPVSAI